MIIRLNGVIFLLSVLSCALVGCGQNAPDGFPKVYPCTIKVVNGGTPVEGVAVGLTMTSNVSYASGGATDVAGIAVLGTAQGNFRKAGVPAGNYKVILSKAAPVSETLTEAQAREMTTAERQAFMRRMSEEQRHAKSVVPANLSHSTKTPLQLTVTEQGQNILEIDFASY